MISKACRHATANQATCIMVGSHRDGHFAVQSLTEPAVQPAQYPFGHPLSVFASAGCPVGMMPMSPPALSINSCCALIPGPYAFVS